jgi:prepilin-type N-terminal cleavage/methylation domain-containing protein
MARRAFTLVELLVVIAIIGMLVALLLPAINSARESGRRVTCSNNIKQVGLAAINYQEDLGAFPFGERLAKGQDPTSTTQFGPNWAILILPYLESHGLYNEFTLTKPISDQSNANARATRIPTLLCPSDALYNSKPYMPVGRSAEGENWARGNYAANGSIEQFNGDDVEFVGPGSSGWAIPWLRGVMGVNESCTMKQILDGASHTCLIGEVRAGVVPVDRRGTWAMGAAGASLLFGHGATDDHGPNNNAALSDDTIECDEIEQTTSSEMLVVMQMGCYGGGGNTRPRPAACIPAASISACATAASITSTTASTSARRGLTPLPRA